MLRLQGGRPSRMHAGGRAFWKASLGLEDSVRKEFCLKQFIALLIFALGLVFAAAGPGLAGCPTAKDKGKGIVLTRTESFLSNLYLPRGEHEVVAQRLDEKGEYIRSTYTVFDRGLLGVVQQNAKMGIEIDFEKPIASFFPLAEGKKWTSAATYKMKGVPIGDGSIEFDVVARTQIRIGSCRYDVFEVLERNVLVVKDKVERSYRRWYSPEFGFSLGTIVIDKNGKPVSSVLFDEITTAESH